MTDTLSTAEVEDRLPRRWVINGSEIERTFTFDDYLAGVEFAAEVGELSEEEFHHPTIIIGYKEVTVRFTTHEADGITKNDIHMAELVNEL